MSPSIAERLAPWFAARARDLPFRRARTPYRVWVSEVMLQQTRVATVVEYFPRFIARFPDVASLAQAEQADVLAAWSGLGYYRRARALHEGARFVVAHLGGRLPRRPEELARIPGIGPYTAGAIASVAFGVQAPLVDGNVARVLSRLFALDADPSRGAGQRAVWALAASLVPARAPGVFNEALMELGATVCTPTSPRCGECPLAVECEALRRGEPETLPRLGPRRAPVTVYAGAIVVRERDRVLLGRRRPDALYGGMWEPPHVEARDAEEARRLARALVTRPHGEFELTHALTHRTLRVTVTRGGRRARAAYPDVYEEVRLVGERDLASYGVSALAKKVLRGPA
ncbi:MAG: A/G-specific adenine glycosylase [Polyangiaceae bacterium]|nr:A/G-specific adenine glycosylase [Polyangiaceae bacterium]